MGTSLSTDLLISDSFMLYQRKGPHSQRKACGIYSIRLVNHEIYANFHNGQIHVKSQDSLKVVNLCSMTVTFAPTCDCAMSTMT